MKNSIIPFLDLSLLIIMILLMITSILLRNNNTFPHVLILSEEMKIYHFGFGSSELSTQFRKALDQMIIPQIMADMKNYGCDTIEVFGHTDSAQFGKGVSAVSTMDNFTLEEHNSLIDKAVPGSNPDLGLKRAYCVGFYIKEKLEKALHARIFLYGYSAGSLINPDGTLLETVTGMNNPQKRRIEIRIRRSNAI